MVRAHDPGISTAEARLRGGGLELTTGFAPDDAKHFLGPGLRSEEKWDEAHFESVRRPLEVIAATLWELRVGEETVPPRSVRVELLPGDNVSFQLAFPFPDRRAPRVLRALKLPELPAEHRQFVIVFDERGSAITKKLLSGRDYTIEVPAETETVATPTENNDTAGATFWGFFRLGVEHIWMGYDHLLFLFALLVVCRSFRSIVAIVSCFTIAHSITLALATLDVVNLPARLVEPLIAASIVFVGVENLARRGEEPKGRWLLTFVFGLIHGFGFAGVLRDLGVGREGSESIVMPLLSFNLGVEIGQIVVAGIVLPLVWQLRKRPLFVTRGVPVLSLLVATAGLYWLLERTLF